MGRLERFVAFGSRTFAPDRTFGRVAFQPILYLVLWAAAIRLGLSDYTNIPFREVLTGWTEALWEALSIGCPPLAGVAWWMIVHRPPRAKLAGHWLRLSADIGMLVAVLTYHVATVLGQSQWRDDATIYSRYLTGSVILFLAVLVVRDVWVLVTINRLAAGIRDGRLS